MRFGRGLPSARGWKRHMAGDDEYGPAYQDEYRRLWHREAERVRRVRAVLRDPVRTYSLNDGDEPVTPMMTETAALWAALNDTDEA
jgi:hypothetical protein